MKISIQLSCHATSVLMLAIREAKKERKADKGRSISEQMADADAFKELVELLARIDCP